MAEAGQRERKLRKELLASTAAMSAEERLATASQLETRIWPLSFIRAVLPRRYLHRETGVELFFRQNSKSSQQSAVLLNISQGSGEQTRLLKLLSAFGRKLDLGPEIVTVAPPQYIRSQDWTQQWRRWKMSTFEYLMRLNTAAGRTYNDLTQYPVYPWVITDLESEELDLTAPGTFRDFTKPIGAINAERLAKLKYKATEMEQMSPDPFFLYGSHYSNVGTVLFFLLRLEPFTSCAVDMQGGHFDHSDRLFSDFSSAWSNCMINDSDLKVRRIRCYVFCFFPRHPHYHQDIPPHSSFTPSQLGKRKWCRRCSTLLLFYATSRSSR